jgi:hypothetical protein
VDSVATEWGEVLGLWHFTLWGSMAVGRWSGYTGGQWDGVGGAKRQWDREAVGRLSSGMVTQRGRETVRQDKPLVLGIGAVGVVRQRGRYRQ